MACIYGEIKLTYLITTAQKSDIVFFPESNCHTIQENHVQISSRSDFLIRSNFLNSLLYD